MAQLYEYYNTNDDAADPMYADEWQAQSFTPSVTHTITSVKLKLCDYGKDPGTVTVSIRATDIDGLPTGGDLCSGTITGASVPYSPGWVEITFSSGYVLNAGTKYAIVVRCSGADVDHEFYWRCDVSSPTYSGGTWLNSGNGGASWTADPLEDFMFEEWGTSLISAPICITQEATNLAETSATINGKISDDGGESCEARFRWRKANSGTEEQTVSNYQDNMWGGYNERQGQKLTIPGRTVNKLAFKLASSGYPTGNVTFAIHKLNDDIIGSKVLGDASIIAGIATWYEVTLDTPVFVNEEVRISAEFSGGDSSNFIGARATSDCKANEVSQFYTVATGWHDYDGEDRAYIYTYGDDWVETDWQTTLETDDEYHEDLTDLEENTEYEFQTQAKNSEGEGEWTESAYFETLLPVPPVAVALDASSISCDSAWINGQVSDDAGGSCEARFRHRKIQALVGECYNEGGDQDIWVYGTHHIAQTFTPEVSHRVTSVKVLLARTGFPVALYAAIMATSSGKPTGENLCSGVTVANTLPTDEYEWREIALGDGCELEEGTQYALVLRALYGDNNNYVRWRYDATAPTYAGGCLVGSTDAGGHWTLFYSADCLFGEYGIVGEFLYEYYNEGDTFYSYVYGNTWRAQTFTPLTSHTISGVNLPLKRAVGTIGTITVGIKATDVDGKPTGDDLCSGTTNGNTLPYWYEEAEWRTITFEDGADLEAGVKYAIVVRITIVDPAKYLYWSSNLESGPYPRGNYQYSTNAGASWTVDDNKELLFEEFSIPEWTETDWQNSLETDDTYFSELDDLESESLYEFQTQAKDENGEGEWSDSKYFVTLILITHPPVKDTVRLSSANPLYRNRQYILGSMAKTSEQTENFTGDGSTKSFSLGFPLAEGPVITEDYMPMVLGIKGLSEDVDYYWEKGSPVITADVAPDIGVDVEVVYYGLYPVIISRNNLTAQVTRQSIEGGSGLVEDAVIEQQHESREAAIESADAKLQQYCRDAETLVYRTWESGLAPGQLQKVTYAPFGFDKYKMLIESIVIYADGDDVRYDVSCVTGPTMGSWTQFFARLVTKFDKQIRIGGSLLQVSLEGGDNLEVLEDADLLTDDFSGGIVGRWMPCSIYQTGRHFVQHERLDMNEEPTLSDHETENYLWDAEDSKWDYATWG